MEKNVRVLKRLYFVKYRHQEHSVKEASEMVGITEVMAMNGREDGIKMGLMG